MDWLSLGRYLRDTREAKELTLEDAERRLHIRSRILEAFESGNFDISGASPVQLRGFISNYARYLGLDEERTLQYYDAALAESQRRERRGARKRKAATASQPLVAARAITDTQPTAPAVSLGELAERRSSRRFGLLNRLLLALIALASLGIIAFVVLQVLDQPESPDEVLDVAPQLLLVSSPTPLFTQPPVVSSALLAPTPLPQAQQNYSGRGVLVTIQMAQRSWLRLVSDGVEQFVGIARPGDILEYPAQNEITLTASNAEALIVTWNGQPQGSMGGRGQKVDVRFGIETVDVQSGPGFEPTSEFTATPIPTLEIDVGELISALTPTTTPGPSPTASSTPTVTNTPSATFTPSNTPTATLTPSITPTPSDTPTITLTPTVTLTPSPTAILPPRVTQENLSPTKEGA